MIEAAPEPPVLGRDREEQQANYERDNDWRRGRHAWMPRWPPSTRTPRARRCAAIESLDLDPRCRCRRTRRGSPRTSTRWSVRWVCFHLIEELARHAGHADIVREHVDGATMYELMAGAEGWPETPWLKPWRPPAA